MLYGNNLTRCIYSENIGVRIEESVGVRYSVLV